MMTSSKIRHIGNAKGQLSQKRLTLDVTNVLTTYRKSTLSIRKMPSDFTYDVTYGGNDVIVEKNDVIIEK